MELPAKCLHCGHTFRFLVPNWLPLGANSSFSSNSTRCPKCGGSAAIADAVTDSAGRLHIVGVLGHLRKIDDLEHLRRIQTRLETVQHGATPSQVRSQLSEVDSEFSQLLAHFGGLGQKDFVNLVSVIVSILALWIMLRTQQAAEQGLEIQSRQLALSAEEFVYQKERDAKQDKASEAQQQSAEQLLKRIEELERSLQRPEDIRTPAPSPQGQRPRSGKRLKGAYRNKPCPCGSTRKAKYCHPDGY